jgi:GNAT superfamily N-acetyltransferase
VSGALRIAEARDLRQREAFATFPWKIYSGDPLWVPPILADRLKTIDPEQGAFFDHGRAGFFMALQGERIVGTIMAAEDQVTNAQRGRKDCMIGFFETVDDRSVADALFQAAGDWAKARGLDALYGPFNLDYEDGYGVLIEGRDRPPVILCGHSPPYYQAMFEGAGFLPARGDNLAYEIPIRNDHPERARLAKLAERMRRRGWVTVRGADLTHWEDEVDRVYDLINAALRHLPDFIPWQRQTLHDSLAPFVRFADPDLILFAEVNGQPVGWFPGIPNINEALIQADGLRHVWDYARLWLAMRRRPDCLAIKSVLVLPEYWDTGVALLLFDEMARRALAKGYVWADLSLTSADNPYTPGLADRLGANLYKRYRVYRKALAQAAAAPPPVGRSF